MSYNQLTLSELKQDIKNLKNLVARGQKYEEAASLRDIGRYVEGLSKVPNCLLEDYCENGVGISGGRLKELIEDSKELTELFHKWDYQRIIDRRNDIISDLLD